MRKHLLLLLVFAFPAENRAEQSSWTADITLRRIEEKKEVEGYWVLSSEWTGYMGLALELRDGRFRFWFRSDHRSQNEPQYPISGKYSVEGGMLVLMTSVDLYDTHWFLISHEGRVGLFPASNVETIIGRKESPAMRMLFRIDDELAKKSWPIYNEPEKEPNQPPEPMPLKRHGSS